MGNFSRVAVASVGDVVGDVQSMGLRAIISVYGSIYEYAIQAGLSGREAGMVEARCRSLDVD